jgi:ribosome-binding factor A
LVAKTRLTRIAERIWEELSEILIMESSDPRLKGITITDVKVDRELAYAEIYVCTIEGVERSQEVLSVLEHAQGFLRSELAHRMDLRVFPRLRFHWDPTLEHADKIERLIKTIHEEDVPEKVVVKKKKKVAENNGSKS